MFSNLQGNQSKTGIRDVLSCCKKLVPTVYDDDEDDHVSAEDIEKLGFTYFFVLHRFHDIDPQLISEGW